MKIGSKKYFVDTNVLVYATFEESEFYPKALQCVEKMNPDFYVISRQVVMEYISIVTSDRIYKKYLSPKKALDNMILFQEYVQLLEKEKAFDLEILKTALSLYPVSKRNIFDLNIYITMVQNGLSTIVTANEKDFRGYEKIKIMNPFKE
jgi:predicted nucleic acid-binding protein